MKKRRSATYVEPTTLGDLRQILTDHESFPDSTRVWIRHNAVEGQPAWSSIEVSHAAEEAK